MPYAVVNDGDVSALAGAMSLEDNNVLGIAMGTSEAVGYVDEEGNITGWLNELAFVPVDAAPTAMVDEWSGDIGCGVKYFSQDSVIKLAPAAGIELDPALSPAEKLKVVQGLMEQGDPRAAEIYRVHRRVPGPHPGAVSSPLRLSAMCCCWAGSCPARAAICMLETCQARSSLTSTRRSPSKIHLALPDEKFRRVGQSAAAASLPELRK